jgi:hypothetical protein
VNVLGLEVGDREQVTARVGGDTEVRLERPGAVTKLNNAERCREARKDGYSLPVEWQAPERAGVKVLADLGYQAGAAGQQCRRRESRSIARPADVADRAASRPVRGVPDVADEYQRRRRLMTGLRQTRFGGRH